MRFISSSSFLFSCLYMLAETNQSFPIWQYLHRHTVIAAPKSNMASLAFANHHFHQKQQKQMNPITHLPPPPPPTKLGSLALPSHHLRQKQQKQVNPRTHLPPPLTSINTKMDSISSPNHALNQKLQKQKSMNPRTHLPPLLPPPSFTTKMLSEKQELLNPRTHFLVENAPPPPPPFIKAKIQELMASLALPNHSLHQKQMNPDTSLPPPPFVNAKIQELMASLAVPNQYLHQKQMNPETYLPSPPPPINATMLSKEQAEVLRTVAEGRSVFITGSAGTGKSFLLKHAIRILKDLHTPRNVFVTASTGVAACALNGNTLHSFSGIGVGSGDRDSLLHKVAKNKPASKRWKRAKALVIDEVSMIDGEFFDHLELIARTLRANVPRKMKTRRDEVWGGIQLIVSGDFFQLPPISPTNPDKEFVFEADCWNASFDLQVELTHVFRQSDSRLVELLQGIRKGHMDVDHLQLLSHCFIESELGEWDSSVTRLYPRNEDVKMVNETRLRSLGGEIIKYKALDKGKDPWKRQLRQGISPEELELCLGARVMLTKNIDPEIGLVNGSTGTVKSFIKSNRRVVANICDRRLLPMVLFDSGLEMVVQPDSWDVIEGEMALATRRQVPLILAWALSIHKCQGMTLDRLHTDLSRAFGCGMVYVALSRVRSLDGLYLSGFSTRKIKAHPKVLQYYQQAFVG